MRICTLMSGSSGNSIYIETAETKVLIDAGHSGKGITKALEEGTGVSPVDLDGIMITHAHRDHVHGAGVMSRRYNLPLYATEGTWYEMEPMIGNISPALKNVIGIDESLQIGDLKVETFATSHDAMDSIGYICTSGNKSAGIATDSGVFTARMEKLLRGMDMLVLEANHDPFMLKNSRYPWSLKKRIAGTMGHLSNADAGRALLKTLGEKTKNVVLAHLSEENNKPALALETVQKAFHDNKINLDDVNISVAPRYRPGKCINI